MSHYTFESGVERIKITFLCEGCGRRFYARKLFGYTNNNFLLRGDYVNREGSKLANYVCSRECDRIATQKKRERDEDLSSLLKNIARHEIPSLHGFSKKRNFTTRDKIVSLREEIIQEYIKAELEELKKIKGVNITKISHDLIANTFNLNISFSKIVLLQKKYQEGATIRSLLKEFHFLNNAVNQVTKFLKIPTGLGFNEKI